MFKGKQNTVFHLFSHLFMPFSHFVRAFFILVCRKETKHVKTVTDVSNVELRHFSSTCDFRTRHATFVSHPFFPATWLSRLFVSDLELLFFLVAYNDFKYFKCKLDCMVHMFSWKKGEIKETTAFSENYKCQVFEQPFSVRIFA